jgi:hypothetical protein
MSRGMTMTIAEGADLLREFEAHAAAAVEVERARFEALDDENATTIEGIDETLPHYNHVHASGEEEEQNLIERAETLVTEWKRERAQRKQAERERDDARADLDRRNADDRAVIERLNARRETATIDEAGRAALVAALRAACDWAPLVDTRSFVVPIDAAVYVAHEHAAAERAARAEAEKALAEARNSMVANGYALRSSAVTAIDAVLARHTYQPPTHENT